MVNYKDKNLYERRKYLPFVPKRDPLIEVKRGESHKTARGPSMGTTIPET